MYYSIQQFYNHYLNELYQQYLFLKLRAKPYLKHPYVERLDTIDLIIFWTIILLFALSAIYLLKSFVDKVINFPFINKLKRISFIKKKIHKKTSAILEKFEADVNEKRIAKKTIKLPVKGFNSKTIKEKMDELIKNDNDYYKSKKLSGAIYYPEDEDMLNLIKNYSKEFMFHNPLHFDIFPSVSQMEAEIIVMTAGLFHPTNKVCGLVTSGGTESILLAILAYRERARDLKGITKPNLVASESVHVAFQKACFYFGIKLISIPLKNYVIDVKKLARAINNDTIAIVGSFPEFSYCLTDPIEELSKIAIKKKVPLHVDACLGSFVAPFANQFGVNIGKFDFELPGVTSISCDPHKFGLSPKGLSVLLFRDEELRAYSMFSSCSWIGGLYTTPTIAGSRSGGPIAGGWIALTYNGVDGYKHQAKIVIEGLTKLVKELRKIPEISIIGDPKIFGLAFKSNNKQLDIYEVLDQLSKKGWHLASCQKPPAIHHLITSYNVNLIDNFVKDVKAAIAYCLEHPTKKKSGTAAIYGSTTTLPDDLVNDATKLIYSAVFKIQEKKNQRENIYQYMQNYVSGFRVMVRLENKLQSFSQHRILFFHFEFNQQNEFI